MFRWRTEECWLDIFLNCQGGGGRGGVNTCIPKQTYIPVICQDARGRVCVCVFVCVCRVSGPMGNHNTIGFLSNTGSELTKARKATKSAFNVRP